MPLAAARSGGRPRSGASDPTPWQGRPDLLGYPEELPVVAAHDEILAAIRDNQVVVIAGETGSGKTTQIPKICLELGRGADGTIGHTQPRRIAARSVAERVAEELGVDLGAEVGYQVRFTDRSTRDTRLKVMTDGILLGELQRDRDLRRYDTIIIDEAHERSLTIDFILGYLRSLLPRRPDLKVVVTSATIDPERFARHFTTDPSRPVPVIGVSGRTYPVEIRYRPLVERDEEGRTTADRDQVTAICEAVEELWTERAPGPGGQDILVFLSGEREIRDAAEALRGMELPRTDILQLYSRLSAAEQHRVFERGSNRRIILATNVAETSITVPGIRYVVDTGTARISRYSQRTKVQRLPIEAISQASATQRSGRCGRLADGIAIRLYGEEDFESRPAFTEPEILRTSLAAVILQMTSLGLGDVARFPFIDAPDSRQVADGLRLLEELHAIEDAQVSGRADRRRGRDRRGGRGERRRLTAYGRMLARLPLDPRLGRMLIEADRRGCTAEVLVIVAALSIQDVRERPTDQQTQADQAHARFKATGAGEGSDFASVLALWRYLKAQQKALSGSAFRRMCKAEFLHYLRVREWQDLHTQLVSACKDVKLDPRRSTAAPDADPDWDRIHQALLAGLLSHVGLRDERTRDYLGARGARFAIQPGSVLFRRQPDYVMAAELVETTRLWARTNARIDPRWAEELGAHLVKRSYAEPHWSRAQGSVLARERVTMYGVPLAVDRRVQYGRIDPEEARELFIRHALVEGDWDTRHRFLADNARLRTELEELEERSRRRDIVVGDEVVYDFYDRRIPPDVVSGRHFDSWWKKAGRTTPDLLTMTPDLLTREEADDVSERDYPLRWSQGEIDLSVGYQFNPGATDDGVTVTVPVGVLNQVRPEDFEWQVPGLRGELVTALIRTLPKELRRRLVPAPDHAAKVLRDLHEGRGRLVDEVARLVQEQTGVPVKTADFDLARLPDHVRVTFAVTDDSGRVIGRDKDLDALRERLAPEVRASAESISAAVGIERAGLRTWDLGHLPDGRLPEEIRTVVGGLEVVSHPALVDEHDSVRLTTLPDRAEAEAATRLGVRRLLLLGTSPPWKRVLARLGNTQKLALGHNPHGSVPALLEDCLAAAVDDIVAERLPADAVVRTPEQFADVLGAVRTHAATRVLLVIEDVEPVLTLAAGVRADLARPRPPAMAATVADARAQLDSLIRPGFVATTGVARLPHLRRYLTGIQVRMERADESPSRDAGLQSGIDEVETAYADLLDSLSPGRARAADVRDIAWMIEELRVGTFAQRLGTAHPVSVKRVLNAIRAVD
ncbi:ATP-dependent RNA helicase HrpA [Nostocoides sp. F2B08]|uniref:ATP-dependent RNA helicase HrpA n=1 Tax=Nostocoides sp. F2B08 TaxID=2653936 RepID=UPI0012632934|nr:ATP-dependent RNA helicase HrpA [Tetrasphaera sp. F2B08]KAB7741034.1 ATP-dependent RNA helicase HrpA [Tetrasphaera sp. F2B08]